MSIYLDVRAQLVDLPGTSDGRGAAALMRPRAAAMSGLEPRRRRPVNGSGGAANGGKSGELSAARFGLWRGGVRDLEGGGKWGRIGKFRLAAKFSFAGLSGQVRTLRILIWREKYSKY